jgi:hypothetical protein
MDSSIVTRLIHGLKSNSATLQKNVPRAEDLPYSTSPPVQFVYRSTASLDSGNYIWEDTPAVLTPLRPILANALYFFRKITLVADVAGIDFDANVVTPPQFYVYRKSDGGKTVLFREPITMPTFLQGYDYRLFWKSQRIDDELYCAFRGQLVQGPSLIGKSTITLTAMISAQEIFDVNYINEFMKSYPIIAGGKE